jgi:hypothetical protein
MKYVRYFGKTMMTDKFVLCMILAILLALLAIVIVAIMKGRK